MASEPRLPNVGDVVDRKYRIDALIGEGGMGAVFAVTHLALGSRRAIKWLLPKLASHDNAVRRFLAEAKVAAKINHVNVVSPIDVSDDTGAPYIVMELLEGESLGQHLGGQRLPFDKAGRIFMPVLQGVAAAHAQSVVHRDLKPGNIFLARQPGGGLIPKVLDFGIAKVIDGQATHATLTDQGQVLGTIQYMSPEQLQDASSVGPATDVYALGVILYRMLAGKLPYEGNLLDLALRIREGRPAPLGSHVAGLPAGFESVVMRALSASLQERYPDTRSLAEALAPYFPPAGFDVGATQPISERPGQFKERGVFPVAAGADAAAAAAALGAGPRAPAAAPRKEVSTFHPVVTAPARSDASRVKLVAAMAGVAIAGAAVAFMLRTSGSGDAGGAASAGSESRAPVPDEEERAAPTAAPDVPATPADAGADEVPGWEAVPGAKQQPTPVAAVPAVPASKPPRRQKQKPQPKAAPKAAPATTPDKPDLGF